MLHKIVQVCDKLQEKELPKSVLEAIEDIYRDEVYGTDADALNILGNYDHEGDDEITALVEELYDLALKRAELYEFAVAMVDGDETDLEGPYFEVEGIQGKVYPHWDGETLTMQGIDNDIAVELCTVDPEADIDPTDVVEWVDMYLEGR